MFDFLIIVGLGVLVVFLDVHRGAVWRTLGGGLFPIRPGNSVVEDTGVYIWVMVCIMMNGVGGLSKNRFHQAGRVLSPYCRLPQCVYYICIN